MVTMQNCRFLKVRGDYLSLLVAGVIYASTVSIGVADVLQVPSESYPTIEDALTVAKSGDTVEVSPGEYMLQSYDGITVPSGVTLEGKGDAAEDTIISTYKATSTDTTSASLLYVTNGIVKNLTFKGARCTKDVGSIYRVCRAIDAALISDCIFTDTVIDHDASSQGRLMHLSLQSKIERSTIRNTTTKNGKGWSPGGAGIVLSDSLLVDSYVTNNVIRSKDVGMVYVAGESIVSGTLIAKNKLLNHEKFGGATPGIKVHSAGGIIEDCIVENNTTENDSAASPDHASAPIYLNGAATVRRTVVRNNTAYSACVGGVWVANGASKLENLLIYGNRITNPRSGTTSTWFYAGGLRVDTAGTKVFNCTVVNNSIDTEVSRFRSHGIYLKNVAAYVRNSIFYGNGPEGSVNFKVESNGTKVDAAYCCSSTAMSGTGCINLDPLFYDFEEGNFQLNEKSPCRNTGTATDAPLDDILGVSRPQEEVHDIGCYEFVYTDDKKLEFKNSSDIVGPKGAEISFEVLLNHVDEFVSHTWKVVDADGNLIIEEVVTDSNEWKHFFAHKYTTFTVTLTTKWSDGETVALTTTLNGVRNKVYVSQEGGNIAPYDTWEKAAHNIKDALDAVYGEEADAPGIVYLAPGIYTSTSGCSADGNYLVSIEKSVRLVGTGNAPDETVLDGEGTRRVLSLTGKGSGVENIMIARARTSSTVTSGSESGFGLNMVNAGIVDNCIVSNAVTSGSVEGSKEAWVYVNGGIITNSVICKGSLLKTGRCIVVVKGSIGTTKIYSNESQHKNGGVVTVTGANSVLVDCDIYSNTDYMREYGVGCGIVAARNSARVLCCRIYKNSCPFNRSARYLGFGINAASYRNDGNMGYTYDPNEGNVLIDKCVVSNNTSSVGDSANSATISAAAVLLGYKTVLRNSLIVNNALVQEHNMVYNYPVSGGIRSSASATDSAEAIVENCTIVGNTSVGAQSQGGVHLLAGSIVNSIVCNNGGQRKNASWIDGNISLANDATATYSLTKGKTEIGDAVAGEGNLAGDPRLHTDYSLRSGSLALNKGLNQDWMKGETDISGKKRISGGKVDLGCYERFMQGFYIYLR